MNNFRSSGENSDQVLTFEGLRLGSNASLRTWASPGAGNKHETLFPRCLLDIDMN